MLLGNKLFIICFNEILRSLQYLGKRLEKHRISNGVNARLEKGYILFTKNLLHGVYDVKF